MRCHVCGVEIVEGVNTPTQIKDRLYCGVVCVAFDQYKTIDSYKKAKREVTV